MSVRAFFQMALSQGTILRRNVTFWLVSLFIAALSMIVFGTLFEPNAARPFDLALVDEDHSIASAELARLFTSLDTIEVRYTTRQEGLDSVGHGDLRAVLIVPSGFEKDLDERDARVQAYYDNSNPIRVGFVASVVESAITAFSDQVDPRSEALTLERQALNAEGDGYIDFLTPGMVGMSIMFTNLAVGALMVGWREQGILRRLGVTPLRPGVMISSQALSFAAVSFAQVAIILALGRFVFDVRVEGSFLLLVVTVVLGVLCMLSIGYVLASFVRAVSSYNVMQQLVAFPMLFLGGSYFPVESSGMLAPIINAVPLTHLNNALRAVINDGDGISELWVSWLVLAVWAIMGFVVSMRLFRWQ
jgi:ABC-2 type transport system permease protein